MRPRAPRDSVPVTARVGHPRSSTTTLRPTLARRQVGRREHGDRSVCSLPRPTRRACRARGRPRRRPRTCRAPRRRGRCCLHAPLRVGRRLAALHEEAVAVLEDDDALGREAQRAAAGRGAGSSRRRGRRAAGRRGGRWRAHGGLAPGVVSEYVESARAAPAKRPQTAPGRLRRAPGGGYSRPGRRERWASRSAACWGPTRPCWTTSARRSRRSSSTCPGRTSSTGSSHRRTDPAGAAEPAALFAHGRLAGTGYLSILPVDQGIEHSAGASFAPNPMYFDPENIVKLAIEGGCNAVASTFGVLGVGRAQVRAQDPVHREAQPQRAAVVPEHATTRSMFGTSSRRSTWARRASARRSTAGRTESTPPAPGGRRRRSQQAHELGMFTVLWCYLRNAAFKTGDKDYHVAADLTGPGEPPRRDDPGRHHQAEAAREQRRLQRRSRSSARRTRRSTRELTERPPDRPDALPGGELLHGPRRARSTPAARRARTISRDAVHDRRDQQARRRHGPDLAAARRSRGRMKEGVELLHAIQDVYLCKDVTVA